MIWSVCKITYSFRNYDDDLWIFFSIDCENLFIDFNITSYLFEEDYVK